MKNGKLPISKKPQSTFITPEMAYGGGTHDLPPDIRAHMEAQGWVPRWLDAKKVYDNQGVHPRGWRVYKRPKTADSLVLSGTEPDGVVRRGTTILGYKLKEEHATHKGYLEQQRRTYSGQSKKLKEQMIQEARNEGFNMRSDEDDE